MRILSVRLSVLLSVRLSVCLSVTRVYCDKTVERSVQIFIPYERQFILVFWEEESLVGATPSTWNFGSTDPRWSEIADFQPIIARSALAVAASEKSSINTNRKSTTHFPMSLRWSSYVASKYPKGGLKNAKRPIFVKKIAFRLKKVCYRVSLCENCQPHSCKAVIVCVWRFSSLFYVWLRTRPICCKVSLQSLGFYDTLIIFVHNNNNNNNWPK